MYLIEEHIISKNHSLFKECDKLCFASKNLYNFTVYTVNNIIKDTNKLPSGFDLYHIIKHEECFKVLPNDLSTDVVFQVRNSWNCFFKAIKAWKRDKSKFLGVPRPPKFKHKEKGRNVVNVSKNCVRIKKGKLIFNKHINLSLKTNLTSLVQVKIVPQSGCYKILICYKKEVSDNIISDSKIAIDLGINNLCTITNNFDKNPLIINGKPLKAINQYFNKEKAKIQAHLQKNHNKYTSKNLQNFSNKRNNKVKNYLHNTSKNIITYCQENNVSEIAIGYNEGWKQNINLGSKNNQSFTQIPYLTLINQIKYKAELNGITVLLNEESYTSKTSAFDREEPVKQQQYKGKRIKRGLFQTSQGFLVNSDVNGSIQIGYKVFGNSFRESNIGCVVQPLKANPL